VSADYEYSSENCQTVRSDGHDILARYQAYLQKELPTCIQQELEETFEFELDISQQTVKTKAIETLMSLQRRSFEEFMKSEGLSVQSQLVARQKTTHKSQHQLDTDAARCGNAITVPTVAQLPSLDEPGFDPHKDIYTHPLSFSEEVMDISWSSNILAVNQNPDVPNEERARDFKPPANLLWHQPENISHFGADLRIDWEWHDE
jgi:hypothetical protein